MANFNGFQPRYTINGAPMIHETPVIGDSIVITLGDAIKITPQASTEGGYAEPADAITDRIYGYAVGFIDSRGIAHTSDSANFDGTYVKASSGDTYTAASDNLSDKFIRVVVILANNLVVSGVLDAAGGTTAGSNLGGNYISILTTDSRKLDENTVSATAEQFITVRASGTGNDNSAVDPQNPDSTTRILVRAAELLVPASNQQ